MSPLRLVSLPKAYFVSDHFSPSCAAALIQRQRVQSTLTGQQVGRCHLPASPAAKNVLRIDLFEWNRSVLFY